MQIFKKLVRSLRLLILLPLVLGLTACGYGGSGSWNGPLFGGFFETDTFNVNTNSGPNGSISPNHQIVDYGTYARFTITANTGYAIVSASGCGGSLSGNIYTTDAIIRDGCTVQATYAALE